MNINHSEIGYGVKPTSTLFKKGKVLRTVSLAPKKMI
jgi:hypothetical protein